MVEPLRHRQTKGAETDMPGLPPPRHIPTLPPAGEDAARDPEVVDRDQGRLVQRIAGECRSCFDAFG